MKTFGKVITAMITPFNEDRSVDYSSAVALAQHLVANGSDGLVVAGSTGESATLSKEEKLTLFRIIKEAVGDKASIIAGTGSNDTAASIALTEAVAKLNVDGAMVVGPYYNKPPQEAFYQHFAAIAKASDVPLILYNVPGRTASNIAPATIARLAELPSVAAVKEASGSLDQVSEIIRLTNGRLAVYSGDDSLTLPILAVGGAGIISVASHLIGNRLQEMVTAFFQGNLSLAQQIHLELFPLFKAMFLTTNPIPVKTSVHFLGLSKNIFRLPMIEASPEEAAQLRKIMNEFQLLK